MPAYFVCPICKEDGQFGFSITNGGMYYYHTRKSGETCRHFQGSDGKNYKTELDLFNAVVAPQTPDNKENRVWIEARRADLSGHPRKAKKLYKKWQELAEGGS